jgi:hypothetical protein
MLGMVSDAYSGDGFWVIANCGVTDKPDEMLESDAKFISGHNPTVEKDSAANK